MRDIMAITKALADQNRVSILLALQSCELCVCQIIALLNLAPSTVSKHLSILRQARLVEDRKEGRWVHYRLAGEAAPPEVRAALAWVCTSLADSDTVQEHRRRLEKIVAVDPSKLCSE
ncbi:ArsR/SmtB family transcription factor [Desulfoferrobacter suflitae]|uniref:ArsR/SmtB family transcription factor n=1 Tax=Desulfoferrobacter suflitae TaxID=2865782 RepID=UPI002164154F|nr:metalloregulator ArsR/SmtB family transcription factor [Desulfoferrobacter suflitae]MCK8603683.1 metalloregulator ArsR/SmtB family transcription factor [Desulfoferrobacter suflitae]